MQLRFIDQTTESNFKVSVIEREKSDIVVFFSNYFLKIILLDTLQKK